METKCIGGRAHGAFVSADDPQFDARFVGAFEIKHLGQGGYCETCHTAMRWSIEYQRIVDWPEVNLTPHCDNCRASIPLGGHFISNVHIEIDTFSWPESHVREVTNYPVLQMGQFCGPLCLLYFIVNDDSGRLRDVFAR